ncbi:MAG: hypothetical protein ACK4V6_16600, partial [Microthrixaceae bacterium]
MRRADGRRQGEPRPVAMMEDGDQLTSSEREEWSSFWVQLLKGRVLASIVLPIMLALLPIFGPDRVRVAVAAMVVGVSVNLLMLRRVRSGHAVRRPLVVSDVLTVLAVIVFAPEVYAPGVVLIVSISAVFIFWSGAQPSLRFQVPVAIALFAIGLWRDPEMWIGTWLAYVTAASFGSAAIARMAAVAADARIRYDDMVNGIDAMVWEASGATGDADFVSGR